MKAFKTISTIAAAALVLAGCQKTEIEYNPSAIQIGKQITVTATGEVKPTKTVLQNDKSVFWSPNDSIKLIYGNTSGKFISTNTAAAATAEFTGTLNTVIGIAENAAATTKLLYGVYPYQEAAFVDDDGVHMNFPDVQYTTAGTYDPLAFPSVAVSEGLNLAFYNVGSAIAITVGEDNIGRISVEVPSADYIPLAGDVTLLLDADKHPVVSSTTNSVYVVDLLPAGAETFTKGETYCIALLPGDYSKVTFSLYDNLNLNEPCVVRTKENLTLERSKIYDATLEAAPALDLVWGKFSTADSYWYSSVSADGAGFNSEAFARTLAMDDDYIYLPKSSAYAAIIGVSLDGNTYKRLPTSGLSGTTFQTSCARILKNTDPSVNGGKDILLVSNLSAGSEATPFAIWAYTSGVDANPVRMIAFVNDPKNDGAADWRRYGDRFCVTGTWTSGTAYIPSFDAGKSLILPFAEGKRTAVGQIWTATKSAGIIDPTVYPEGSKLLLSNASMGILAAKGDGEEKGWDLWPGTTAAEAVGTWGYQFFEFSGAKYIARIKINGETKAYLEVFKDTAGTEDAFLTTIGSSPVCSVAIQTPDGSASPKSSTFADCSVRVIDGVPYIATLYNNASLCLFKMSMK